MSDLVTDHLPEGEMSPPCRTPRMHQTCDRNSHQPGMVGATCLPSPADTVVNRPRSGPVAAIDAGELHSPESNQSIFNPPDSYTHAVDRTPYNGPAICLRVLRPRAPADRATGRPHPPSVRPSRTRRRPTSDGAGNGTSSEAAV